MVYLSIKALSHEHQLRFADEETKTQKYLQNLSELSWLGSGWNKF